MLIGCNNYTHINYKKRVDCNLILRIDGLIIENILYLKNPLECSQWLQWLMRYCPWTTKLVPQRAHWLVFSYFSIFESRSPQYYFSINTTSFNLFEPHYLKTQFSSNSTIHSLNKNFLYVNPYFLPYFHYFIAAYSSKNLYYKIHYFLTTHSFFFFKSLLKNSMELKHNL